MTSRILLFLCCAAALSLTGCPTDGRRDTFDYLRSPVTFRLDPVPAGHPFCLDASRRLPGTTEQECRDAGKYILRWDRPEDTVGFVEYRIYVDTAPPNAVLPWSGVRKDRLLASFIMEGRPSPADSILFVLSGAGWAPQTASRDSARILALDTSGRLDSTGELVFSIVTAYRESGLDGQPRYTWAITNDRFPPYPSQPVMTPKDRSVEIAWDRPRDRTDFFDPGADSGIIREYYLRVTRGGILHANRPGIFEPVLTYAAGGVDRTAEVTVDSFRTARNAPGRLFRLPDSQRVFNRDAGDYRDSLRVVLAGLSPQDTVDISLWAADSSGNFESGDAGAFKRVLLTDTTQPTTPLLRTFPATITRNGFVYAFTASRDRVESGGGLVPAGQPNANILEYRVSRRRVGGSAGGEAGRDTVIQVTADRRDDTLFTDTVRYLPPGIVYRIRVEAVDSTGHLSEADSLDVTTLPSAFTGPDSAATCPPGFIALPGGAFTRGDTAIGTFYADEKPALTRHTRPFCIEPFEHRDSAGAFKMRVTWQQAHDVCRDLSQSLSPGDSTWLCTEAEWERACEGVGPSEPLVYGIQSERQDPAGVRFTCNIATGDSAMAMSPALRDPKCLTYDGVFDMAGNLAEWVLDPHTNTYPATPDTLQPGVPHTAPSAGARRGFRGNHYLNPNLSPAVLLRNARCSNRDFATQSRPRPFPGCVDPSKPLLAITYNNSLAPRCLPVPDSIPVDSIAAVSPARDSSKVLILLRNVAKPVEHTLPFDPAYAAAGARPIAAQLTPRSLAVVVFENSETLETVADTLNAAELSGDEAVREAVFAREAAPPWRARKTGGQYDIQYLYAHAQTRNVAAKAYYSNAVLGFRCCSRPRP